MALKVTNNAQSQLASGITAGAVSLTIKAGDGALFPTLSAGDWFPLTLFNSTGNIEVVRVTGLASDTMTIVRGQDGTTARAWNANDFVQLRFTMGAFNELIKRDGSVAMTADLNRDGAATAYRAFGYTTTGGGLRWNHGATGQAETGGNAGSNWALQRFSDAGTAIDTPVTVSRANGQMSLTVRPVFNGNTPYDSGNLPSTNMVWTVSQTFTNGGIGGGNISINVDGGSGFSKYFRVSNNGSTRWGIGGDSTAEGGSNSGSNFFINRYDDTGTLLSSVMTITRASGNITFNGGTLNMSGNRIINGADPINAQDFATKNYADGVMRPLSMLLNPHGSISMDNSGLSPITATGGGPYFAEQWQTESGGTSLAAQSGVGNAGVNGAPQVSLYNPYHLYIRTTTAKATLAAGDYAFMKQPFEGGIAARMQYGITSARYSWLLFRGAATQAATMSVSVRNAAGTRSFVSTVALTTSPTNYAVGIPGDSSGAWVWTNSAAGNVGFCLAAGTTYQTSTLNAWQTGNFIASTTQSNMLDTLNRGFYVSDVGWYDMVLQPFFTPVDLAMEYLRCQRYFQNGTFWSIGYVGAGANQTMSPLGLQRPMRTTPTFAFSGVTYNNCSGVTAYSGLGSPTDSMTGLVVTGTATGPAYAIGSFSANARM